MADERPDSPMHKHSRLHEARHTYSSDEDMPEDTRDYAIAYFRNPLFRTVDGRPGLVQRPSRRPLNSPRGSFVQRGKTAAATVGRVVQSVASSNLWDGQAGKYVKDTGDHRRYRTLPEKHRHHGGDGAEEGEEDVDVSPAGPFAPPPRHHDRHRRGSHQTESPPMDHAHGNNGSDPSIHRTHSHTHGRRSHATSPDLHHRRSHEPRPSIKDYFAAQAYENEAARQHRRNSATHCDARAAGSNHAHGRSPSGSGHLDPRSAGSNHGSPAQAAAYGPSVSPLFATQVARGEMPSYPYRPGSRPPAQKRGDHRSPERVTPGSRPGSGREKRAGGAF